MACIPAFCTPQWGRQMTALGIQRSSAVSLRKGNVARRKPLGLQMEGKKRTAGTSDYSAADASELRKNPTLYEAVSQLEALPPAKFSRKPEVLAPAGGWPQLRAAVENGADAVYFGLHEFNARARASNFDADNELPEVMAYLHQHGVHGYVVLNVLIFDTELVELERIVRKIAAAGVDAVIVQVIVTRANGLLSHAVPLHVLGMAASLQRKQLLNLMIFRPCGSQPRRISVP